MAVCYTPGQVLGQSDLYIEVEDDVGNPTNAYSITYAIYYLDTSSTPATEVLIPPADRVPVNPSVGLYYASIQIPPNATIGEYLIRWTLQETSVSTPQAVVMRFGVVEVGTVTSSPLYSACVLDLIHKFRTLTRDNNPDRNYRFQPPQSEGQIGCYNQVFGFIWEDEEIVQYLEIALWKWNMHPPATSISTVDRLCSMNSNWQAALLWGSLVNAAQALAYNWVANEFSYSIGGISLDIERSSKYMDLKRNAEEQWDKLVEAKVQTVKIVRGLKQPRFGRGVRSAFGPFVGRGVLSPRNFVVFLLSPLGYWALQGALHASHLSALLT